MRPAGKCRIDSGLMGLTVLGVRKVVAIFLTLHLAWLFNVYVPGHVRGMITFVSGSGSAGGAASCCSAPAVSSQTGKAKSPTSKDRAECAVCHFAARIVPTIPFVIQISPARKLGLLPEPVLLGWRGGQFRATYWACGPPRA